VGVVLEDDAEPVASFAPSIDELVARATPIEAMGIDIPIQLNDDCDRPCDTAARRMLSPHTSRVFNAPVQRVLSALTYDEALRISREDCGKGISKQTWHLVPKIAEVERWRASAPCPVYEVHPEGAFAAMAGGVIGASKHTAEGAETRRQVLLSLDIVPPPPPRGVGRDDLLDACAAAWSARRLARGEAICLGPDGNGQAIWF
jgi:predicted RNase H-like nuclease